MEDNIINWTHLIIRPSNESFLLEVDDYLKKVKSSSLVQEVNVWLVAFIACNEKYKNDDLLRFPKVNSEEELSDSDKLFKSLSLSSRPISAVEREGTKLLLAEEALKHLAPVDNVFGPVFKLFSYVNLEIKFENLVINFLNSGKHIKWCEYLSSFESVPNSILNLRNDDTFFYDRKNRDADFDDVAMSGRSNFRINFLTLKKIIILSEISIESFISLLVECKYNEVRSTVFLYMGFDSNSVLIRRMSDHLLKKQNRSIDEQNILYFCILSFLEYGKKIEGSLSWCVEYGKDYPRKDLWKKAKDLIVQVRDVDIPKSYTEYFNLIFKDILGKEILRDLLIYLLHQRIYLNSTNKSKKEWSSDQVAYETILKVFTSGSYSPVNLINDAKKIINNPLQKSRYHVDNLLLAAIDLSFEQEEGHFDEIWDWYKELLIGSNEGVLSHISMFSITPDWVFHNFGAMIVSETTNLNKISVLWDELYSQRFSYKFYPYRDELLGASKHLLRSLRGSLDVLLSNPEISSIDIKSIWLFCTKNEYYISLSSERKNLINENSGFVIMFCYLPHIFRDEWEEQVRYYLNILKHDSIHVVKIVVSLIRNGLDIKNILPLLIEQDIDLKKSFELVYEFHSTLGSPEKFEADFEKIRAELLLI